MATWKRETPGVYVSDCGRYRISKKVFYSRVYWDLHDTKFKSDDVKSYYTLGQAKDALPGFRQRVSDAMRRRAAETAAECRRVDGCPWRQAERRVGVTRAEIHKHQREAAFREALAATLELFPDHWGRSELAEIMRESRKTIDYLVGL